MVYNYQSGGAYGNAVIGEISGTTITYGAVSVFGTLGAQNGMSVATLDSMHFIASYSECSGSTCYTTAVVGVTDGDTTITGYGEKNIYASNFSADETVVTVLDSTHFVIGYADFINSTYYLRTIIGSVSGTTITFGGVSDILTGSIIRPNITALDSTHFALIWSDTSASKSWVIIGETNGDTTVSSYGTAAELQYGGSGYTTTYNSIAKLDSAHFVIAYYTRAVIGSVSGTTISLGTDMYTSFPGWSKNLISVIDTNNFVICADGYFRRYVASGTNIYVANDSNFHPITSFGNAAYTAMAAIDNSHLVLLIRILQPMQPV